MSVYSQEPAIAGLSPRAARWLLAALIGITLALIGITLSPWRSGYADYPGRRPSDVRLYRAEIDRIQNGESYYAAAANELRARGYPTRSVFNWRTPLPMWLLGQLPDVLFGKFLLGAVAAIALCLGFAIVADESGLRQGLLFVAAFSGTLMLCFVGNVFVMPELWSGLLIAGSICCYGRLRLPWCGLALGLAALFVRELAAPYCLLALGLALRGRNWREAGAWVIGLTAYGLFFAWHAGIVQGLLGLEEPAHDHGWIRFGGAAFVLSTAQVNAYLLLLPQWLTAIYFVLALVGLASWSGAMAERTGLTVAGYIVAFGIVGQDFNQYWGLMFGPLLAFGIARAPATLLAIWRAARPSISPSFVDPSLVGAGRG